MQRERLQVTQKKTGLAERSNLVITLRRIEPLDCKVVVGCPGLPNILQTMQTGDAVLLETPSDGLLEVRLIEHNYPGSNVEFLISQISPRSGLMAGAAEIESDNMPFSDSELARIATSIENVKERLTEISELEPEQVQLLSRKLDQIQAASSRMGRKDWVNYVAGYLTSICVSAAFAPDTTRSVFQAVNAAFAWFFASGVLLFQ